MPTAKHTVGVFASLKPQKNHAMLFYAFRKVLDRLPDTQLLVVGDQLYDNMMGTSKYHNKMEELIDRLEIRQQCAFAGNRNNVELLYPACDVTVLSSLYEGTPNVLLESMACGVPVVATNVCDNSYVVKDGQTGFLVELGDVEGMACRVRTLLREKTLRIEMGRKTRRHVLDEFSLEKLAKNTEAVYLEALNGKRGV